MPACKNVLVTMLKITRVLCYWHTTYNDIMLCDYDDSGLHDWHLMLLHAESYFYSLLGGNKSQRPCAFNKLANTLGRTRLVVVKHVTNLQIGEIYTLGSPAEQGAGLPWLML